MRGVAVPRIPNVSACNDPLQYCPVALAATRVTRVDAFRVGDELTVNPLENRIVLRGEDRRITPKTMDVLVCLASAGDSVVEREQLLAAVWGERAVSDEPLTRCIADVRKALDDSRTNPTYIQIVPKRGYRLLVAAGPLAPSADDAGDADAAQPSAKPAGRVLTLPRTAAGCAVLIIAAVIAVREQNPDYNSAEFQLAETLLLRGDAAASQAIFERLGGYNQLKGRAVTHHDLGATDAAAAALAELTSAWGEKWPSVVADVHADRGNLDAAFEWLEKDFEKFGATGWGEVRLQRWYDNLRDDPRWQSLVERAGVSAADRAGLELALDFPGR